MVEQNVPPQLKAVGERMVGVVTRWWEKALEKKKRESLEEKSKQTDATPS